MQIAREQFIEVLKDAYSAYYNLNENIQTDLPLVFRADYKNQDETYFLVKSAKIWVNEKNEHAYIFSAPSFDADSVKACVDYALADGLPRVRPHKEHQCTNIKVVFLADTADETVRKAVKKLNFTKNYKFGLWGYTNLLAGITDLAEQKTVTNGPGHELAAFFKKLFAVRAKGGN